MLRPQRQSTLRPPRAHQRTGCSDDGWRPNDSPSLATTHSPHGAGGVPGSSTRRRLPRRDENPERPYRTVLTLPRPLPLPQRPRLLPCSFRKASRSQKLTHPAPNRPSPDPPHQTASTQPRPALMPAAPPTYVYGGTGPTSPAPPGPTSPTLLAPGGAPVVAQLRCQRFRYRWSLVVYRPGEQTLP